MSTPKPKAAGGSGKAEGRDSWCTPKWLADLIGKVDVDVATNERSHIQATERLLLSEGSDGLYGRPGEYIYKGSLQEVVKWIVFCNPPYAHGEVIKWVRHWRGSRFIFLLRWDPSTEWFAELLPHCGWVWFPKRRINFEPPPGVKASSNPFPHALYMRHPPEGLLDRLAEHGYLFEVDEGLLKPHSASNDGTNVVRQDRGSDSEGTGQAQGAGGSGARDGGASGIAPWIPVVAKPKLKRQSYYEPVFGVPKDEVDAGKAKLLQQLNEEFRKASEEAARKEDEFWQKEYDRQFPGYTGWKYDGKR